MIQWQRLMAAYEKSRLQLLSRRHSAGHWVGELSTSALSTATAISALALVRGHHDADANRPENRDTASDELINRGARWLAAHQNPDGGWGDTDQSYSNIATTLLALSALRLASVPGVRTDVLEGAECYIESHGGLSALRRRYGRDKTFAVPILTNCALAGTVAWRQVSPLPFELACLPQPLYRFLRLPVVSYAIPALVAIGQARFHHLPPRNPLIRLIRSSATRKSLQILLDMLPASGGYLEAVPLTSFVVMSLASIGQVGHPVTQRGVGFLCSSMRADGSWPIDTNLATWNTTLALAALNNGGDDLSELSCLDWLLQCQHREAHPFTGARPGGWGWSDLSGAVPDADDTAGALLTLAAWSCSPGCSSTQQARISEAARNGLDWLRDLQNSDGGWPTFCRGWGKLPFDRSGTDLTAHALRAIHAWHSGPLEGRSAAVADGWSYASQQLVRKGFRFLARRQNKDGSWTPLWFGNQDQPNEENRTYGTARVLLAYRDLKQLDTQPARRGLDWLRAHQHADGSWGTGATSSANGVSSNPGSVEETALALEALLAARRETALRTSIVKGLRWLVAAVESDKHLEPAPIGFYFAKLWYHEQLYPLIFTVSALGRALRCLNHEADLPPATTAQLRPA